MVFRKTINSWPLFTFGGECGRIEEKQWWSRNYTSLEARIAARRHGSARVRMLTYTQYLVYIWCAELVWSVSGNGRVLGICLRIMLACLPVLLFDIKLCFY